MEKQLARLTNEDLDVIKVRVQIKLDAPLFVKRFVNKIYSRNKPEPYYNSKNFGIRLGFDYEA